MKKLRFWYKRDFDFAGLVHRYYRLGAGVENIDTIREKASNLEERP